MLLISWEISWNHIEYKDYVLGLVFYKFLCEKQTNYLIKNWISSDQLKYLDSKYLDNESNFNAIVSDDAYKSDYENLVDAKKDCIDENGYFIDYSNLFSSWLENKNEFNIQKFQLAFNNFNNSVNDEHKSLFKDLFVKFERDLSKLGSDTNEQTKKISSLLDIINDIPSTNQDWWCSRLYLWIVLLLVLLHQPAKKPVSFTLRWSVRVNV
nr:type I restriction-modification system subunit M N-terminal domain-containing protein [Mycoplasmopsis bovis]